MSFYARGHSKALGRMITFRDIPVEPAAGQRFAKHVTEDVRCIRLDSAVTRRIPDELWIGLDPYQFESALSRRAKRR